MRQAAEKVTAPLGGPAKGKGKERGKGREEEGEGKERDWIQVACKDATVLKRAAGELKVGAQAHTRMCVCVWLCMFVCVTVMCDCVYDMDLYCACVRVHTCACACARAWSPIRYREAHRPPLRTRSQPPSPQMAEDEWKEGARLAGPAHLARVRSGNMRQVGWAGWGG